MNTRYLLKTTGLLLILIFGGGFVVRLMRDGDFFIAEFLGGLLGMILLLLGYSLKQKSEQNHNS